VEQNPLKMRNAWVLLATYALPVLGLTLHERDTPAVVGFDIKRREISNPVARDRARRKRSDTVSVGLDNEVCTRKRKEEEKKKQKPPKPKENMKTHRNSSVYRNFSIWSMSLLVPPNRACVWSSTPAAVIYG
jgi:hypothetical protein